MMYIKNARAKREWNRINVCCTRLLQLAGCVKVDWILLFLQEGEMAIEFAFLNIGFMRIKNTCKMNSNVTLHDSGIV